MLRIEPQERKQNFHVAARGEQLQAQRMSRCSGDQAAIGICSSRSAALLNVSFIFFVCAL
jgi:hypothetical protein